MGCHRTIGASMIPGVKFAYPAGIGLSFVGTLGDTSSSAPPGPRLTPEPIFLGPTPGKFEFRDGFIGSGDIQDRVVEEYTPSPGHPNGYIWSDAIGNIIETSGILSLITGSFPQVMSSEEYNMPDGIFIETKFDAPTQDTLLLGSFNMGNTNVSFTAGGNDGGFLHHARIDASGFNGYVTEDGQLLPKDPDDPAGLVSQSFTLDRYYSANPGDWRNKVLRAELRPSSIKFYADGELIISQAPRFSVQLFSSGAYPTVPGLQTMFANFQMFSTFAPATSFVDYVQVGGLPPL